MPTEARVLAIDSAHARDHGIAPATHLGLARDGREARRGREAGDLAALLVGGNEEGPARGQRPQVGDEPRDLLRRRDVPWLAGLLVRAEQDHAAQAAVRDVGGSRAGGVDRQAPEPTSSSRAIFVSSGIAGVGDGVGAGDALGGGGDDDAGGEAGVGDAAGVRDGVPDGAAQAASAAASPTQAPP
jgi:hypothetical protein